MEKNLVTIKVNVAERFYPILIDISEEKEENIRVAEKLLKSEILELKRTYPSGEGSDLSEKDYLAMAALQIATRYVGLTKEKDIEAFAAEIGNANSELENYLKSE